MSSRCAAAEQRANWVGAWGHCEVCDGLTDSTSNICSTECWDTLADRVLADPTPPPTISIAERATVRPCGIVMLTEHEPDDITDVMHLAIWRIPDKASKNAKLVARAITSILNDRLSARWSLTYIFRRPALGRDIVVSKLEAMGEKRDRKTAAAGIKELDQLGCLPWVSQLPDWVDPSEPTAEKVNKSGAFVYSVAITIRDVGQLALEALIRNARLGGITPTERVKRALKHAVKYAEEGKRNHRGYVLARRCTDARFTEDQTAAVLKSYCNQLAQLTSKEAYTMKEAMVTVKSAYRQLAGGK